jgi:hypothetical protein
MRHRSHGDSLGEVTRRRGKRILLGLLCLATMPMILRQYQVQEIFVALLTLAFALVVVLLLLVAFVLLHDGVRRAAVWVKACVTRITGATNLGTGEPRAAHASLGSKR